jgi:hypothetical protein
MTVFAQSEMMLVPLWAFLVLAERPPTQTLVGGATILAPAMGKATLDARIKSAPNEKDQAALPA